MLSSVTVQNDAPRQIKISWLEGYRFSIQDFVIRLVGILAVAYLMPNLLYNPSYFFLLVGVLVLLFFNFSNKKLETTGWFATPAYKSLRVTDSGQIYADDGTINLPSQYIMNQALPATYYDIASMQIEDEKPWYYIVLITHDGEPIVVSRTLRPKLYMQPVIVALHKAWAEMAPHIEAHAQRAASRGA